MKKFIVFEGLDGAGKSTLINSFSQSNPEYQKYYSVPENLVPTRNIISQTEDPLAALHFFGLCNIIRSNEVKSELEKGKSIVMDRYVFTTLAYQHQMIGDKIMDWFNLIIKSQSIILPDLVVFVTAQPEIIFNRINHRDQLNNTTNKVEWYGDEISKQKGQSLKDSYIYFLEMAGVKWFEFDTSTYSMEEQNIELNKKINDYETIND